ncbi:PGC-1 and ERR-induced regulator in muscle protein 1 [Pantherophis guttatus]|uniref:PGC-1 and ERR-induced regulator in muscle protein 1 n=1 Tax=Pantherophis guttatus TaxID=94885 RepID=A0A6P9B0I3_PANGU|nr:PGC-1 and ERR-induced regulator in muscle protein 1 [Pantherophis guttatus]
MENFEYSIQLNDRDWAEFYFVSEECCLIPPALAAAEEQLLSDLEEGEAEGKQGPLAHPKASRLSVDGVPSEQLLAEDAFSGSEDESELGSVSKFLCRSQQVFQPSRPFPSPFSSLPLDPQLPEPAPSSVPLSLAEEGRVGVVGWPMDPKTKAEAHIITQERDSQEPPPRPETGAKSLVLLPPGSSPAAETTESPEGANGLKLNDPQEDHTSLTASAACKFPGSTSDAAVSGQLDFPKLGDAALDPSSLRVPSVLSPTSGEAENPEMEVEGLQVASRTSFQKTRSLSSQEHSVQVTPLLANSMARTSGKEDEDVLKTESGADLSRSFSPNNTSQEGDRAKDNAVEGCPEVLEEDGSPEPSLEVNHVSSGKTERQDNGEPCLHLGPTIPSEGEALTRTQENPRFVPYPLKSNDCSEETVANMTWPEVYDYFFSDEDLHEVERPSSEEGRSWKASHDHPSELPALSGPEMYEYFFQDVGEVEEETWSQISPSETSLSSAHGCDLEEPTSNMSTTDPMGFPEVYEHFFAHQPQDKGIRRPNILAVRASELGKAVRALTSLVGRPVRFLRSKRPKRKGSQARVMLVSPTLLDGTSPRPENLGVAVFKPERPLQLVLTPRDLCLGFVALASWAVKTSDLHSPDAWKIVLLANFGTLSAIRCFRRQVVMESHHGS